MALPTRNDLKDYLRLDRTLTAEDSLLDQLLTRAQSLVERQLGYKLTGAARTHVDYDERDTEGGQAVIRLPGPFKTSSPAPVVTSRGGTTVDASTYYADQRGMRLIGAYRTRFPDRPYTVVATIGLDQHPDYSASLEAIVSTAIIDIAANLYENRRPAVSSEQDEGGASTTRDTALIPDRAWDAIDQLPGRKAGMVLA